MRKGFLFIFGIAYIWGTSYAQQHLPQKAFLLQGTIEGQQNGNIFFSYPSGDKFVKDTAAITDGRFQFKGVTAEPLQVYVSLARDGSNDQTNNTTTIFIEPGNMTIALRKDHFDDAVMHGSKTQEENQELNRLKKPVSQAFAPYGNAYDKANLEYIAAMKRTKNEDSLQYYLDKATVAKDAMDPFIEKLNAIEDRFIKSHPASYVTASMMRYKVSGMSVQEIKSVYDKMPAAVQQSRYGQMIKKEMDNLRMGSPGAKAFQFTTTDIKGNPLSLADFKNKYVLLDFWASWCVPCRKGNPHLITLYNQYKDKGLEIIGVADDDGKPDAWKKAVDKDGIGIWKHVLRGYVGQAEKENGATGSDINDHYGIHTLPTKILISPDGTIIGRYGGGGEDDAAMDRKIQALFTGK